jgi:hypothetical protein
MVRAFAARTGRIVSKVLGSNVIYEQGRRKVTHTHLLDDLADLDGIDLTCHLLQQTSLPISAAIAELLIEGDRA